MITNKPSIRDPLPGERAFSMVEVLIGVAIIGVVFISLFAGMSVSFGSTQIARENLRATQVMLECMEGIRLHTWNQMVYSNMVPASFQTSYYPLALSGQSTGITYYGTIQITNRPMSPTVTYADRMRAITVSVYWTNYYGKQQTNAIVRSRSMTTFTARDGIQNYIYNN